MKATQQRKPIGSLKISKEVIATVAQMAAREVQGVHDLDPVMVDIKGFVTKRQAFRPVGVTLNDDIALIEIHLIISDSAKIPTVAQKVQTAVKESVQSMTGVTVSRVNVVVSGVHFDSVTA